MAYQPIENYGVIGDLHTVALVGMNGSIDFFCTPEFDSPTVFAALLDDKKGGRFSIAPKMGGESRQKQLYLPETNILLTRFLSNEGVAEVSDFMPLGGERTGEDGSRHCIVRRAKCVRGSVHFNMLCDPRFDYGRASHSAEKQGDSILFVSRGDDGGALRLSASVPLAIKDGAAVADFVLNHGDSVHFVLEDTRNGQSVATQPDFVPEAFKATANYWRRWSRHSLYRGRWRTMVQRSALTLKLLTSSRHGSLVAAPTFSLPEDLGGERNWDYRYTWIRDASFTVYALLRLGYTSEAAAFNRWIEDRCGELNPDGSLQIMYAIDGRHELTERTLGHFEGYMGSKPVRIGNGAFDQLQLDIYGELMDSIYIYNKWGEPISYDLWRNLVRLINWVCVNWRLPDEGIWEVRGGRREFLYSRLMSWVAIDRGVRLAMDRSFPAPLAEWIPVRDTIYREIMEQFWDKKRGAFVQYKGASSLDASTLMMPLVKFMGPTDPRWLSTLRAIEEELVDDSLVYRYRTADAASDGLSGGEGTFNMCSFWYVESLAHAGDLDKARFFFEKMLGYANHLGLYSEELGPCGEHLGNFPQAFTHLGLISAAWNLDHQLNIARGKTSPMPL